MYMANHYVRINGTVYVRGECIQESLTEEKAEWLLSAGAIREMDGPAQEAPADTSEAEPDTAVEDDEGIPEDPDAADEGIPEDPDAGDEDDEGYEDAEPPEINALEGLIAPEAEEKPKQPARRTSERRKRG